MVCGGVTWKRLVSIEMTVPRVCTLSVQHDRKETTIENHFLPDLHLLTMT